MRTYKKACTKLLKYHIGEPVLFFDDKKEISIGQIVSISVKGSETVFEIREPSDFSTTDGWTYLHIADKDILHLSDSLRLSPDEWIVNHMADINKAFGKDMSGFIMTVYDSFEEGVKEFDNELFQKYSHQVLDKWVMLLG